MAEESPFLLGRREGNKWIPVIRLDCPVHSRPLEKEGPDSHEMFGTAWRCPEKDCNIRVFVEVDRERLARIAGDFSRS
jgi:hypothetical protein